MSCNLPWLKKSSREQKVLQHCSKSFTFQRSQKVNMYVLSMPPKKAASKSHRKTKRILWTREMEDQLRRLVFVHGLQQWAIIADAMDQTPRQVRQHWDLMDKPASALRQWTQEEDEIIMDLGTKHAGKWVLIASVIPSGRTPLQVRNRWKQLIRNMEKSTRERRKNAGLEEFEFEDDEFEFDWDSIP
jgi:hypothetical protein